MVSRRAFAYPPGRKHTIEVKMKALKLFKLSLLSATIIAGSSVTHANEYFFGNGWCHIETLPCNDGQSISCSANGVNGGFCLAEKNGKYYEITCQANGGYGIARSTVKRVCERKRGFLGF